MSERVCRKVGGGERIAVEGGPDHTARSAPRTSITLKQPPSTRAGASRSSSARLSLLPSPPPAPHADRPARSAVGMCRAGFATSQQAYEAAVAPLCAFLDRGEQMLAGKENFLFGGRFTEEDIHLFAAIVRFDPVYAGHFMFKSASSAAATLRSTCEQRGSLLCVVYVGSVRALARGRRRRWMQKLYWFNDAFSSTCNFEHIKTRYYWSRPANVPILATRGQGWIDSSFELVYQPAVRRLTRGASLQERPLRQGPRARARARSGARRPRRPLPPRRPCASLSRCSRTRVCGQTTT